MQKALALKEGKKLAFGIAGLALMAATIMPSGLLSVPTAEAATFAKGTGHCAEVATVQRGDWLSRIAPQTWRNIATTNRIANANRIFPGEKLCITAAEAHALHGIGAVNLKPAVPATPAVPAKPLVHTSTKPAGSGTSGTASGGAASGTATGSNGSGQSGPARTAPTVPVSGILNEGFCAGQSVDFSNASQWAVPHGCYGGSWAEPNLGYPSWGYCNELAEAWHPWLGHTTAALHLPSHGGYAPKVGATVWYNAGVQGAGPDGHYSVVVAIGPNGWILSADENFAWRGGGFGRVIYRFVHVGSGIDFRY